MKKNNLAKKISSKNKSAAGSTELAEKSDSALDDLSIQLPLPLPAWSHWLVSKITNFCEGFYNVSAKCIGKISNWFKLSEFSSWLNRRLSKRPSLVCVEIIVAVVLSVNFYLLIKPTCIPYSDGCRVNAHFFTYLSTHIGSEAQQQVQAVQFKRLLSPILSAWLVDRYFDFKTNGEIGLDPTFQKIYGLYHAGWLCLLFFILILYRKDALLIILGVFGGLMLNYSGSPGPIIFSYDMPTMLFFTLAFLLYDRGKLWPLMTAILIGGLFKETVMVCAILILLGERWSWKKRLAGFVGTAIAYVVAVKLLMAHYLIKSTISSSASGDPEFFQNLLGFKHLSENISYLFTLDFPNVVFANAGTLLIIMLIPWRSHRDIIFKFVMLILVGGVFYIAQVFEWRDWYEILPLGWILTSEFISRVTTKNPLSPSQSTRNHRVLLGSYWLIILTLLSLAILVKYTNSDARILETLKSKAQKGDAQSQLQLANYYQSGEKISKNPTNAFRWYFEAAQQGVSEAQYQVAMHYLLGNGVDKDINASIPWFSKAAEQGLADAQCQFGVRYAQGEGVAKDFAASIPWFRKAAAQTNMDAQYNLGLLYEHGLGIKQDLAEAAIWYSRAGEKGHVLAQNNLGLICFNFRKDYAEAAQWFRKAAERGNALAQNSLGVLYLQGLGVKADPNEAIRWFQLAGQQGQVEGQKNCGIVFMRAQRFNESAQWFHKAAEQGNAEAEYNLAQYYQIGVGYPQDLPEAALWYARSAKQGYGLAQLALGRMNYTGQGVKADKVEAYKWFKLAQLQGVADAQKELTNCAATMSAEQTNAAENELKKLLGQK